jgi:hypothetical protein
MQEVVHAAMLIRGQPTVARRNTTEWHLLLARLGSSSTWRGSTWDQNMLHIRIYIYVIYVCASGIHEPIRPAGAD